MMFNRRSNKPIAGMYAVVAGLILCGMGTAARADIYHPDVYIKEVSTGTGIASGSLILPVGTDNYFAGFQNISIASDALGSGATSFLAFCVDVYHLSSTAYQPYFSPSTPNNIGALFPAQTASVENLFNLYYAGTVGNNANAAAFQLALWELIQDDGNLATGVVQANASTNATLVANANTLLGNLSYSGPNLYTLTVYSADRATGGLGQNYIVAQPVPEPSTCALAVAGLGLLLLRGRKAGGDRA